MLNIANSPADELQLGWEIIIKCLQGFVQVLPDKF